MIYFIEESREVVIFKLNFGDRLWNLLKTKMEYMHCYFSKRQTEYVLEIEMGEDIVQ